MASDKRLVQLRTDCAGWEARLVELIAQRRRLLHDQARGYKIINAKGKDELPDRIVKADKAVLRHQKGLLNAQARLNRALNGEDV